MVLENSIHEMITRLCEEGDAFVTSGDFVSALPKYDQAWQHLPQPKEDWDAATWILSAIGDAHFLIGDFQNCARAFDKAVRCPGGLGNPFVHLRLGESMLELGDIERAKDELTRAYMGAGREIFADEDAKYFAILNTVLQPTPRSKSL